MQQVHIDIYESVTDKIKYVCKFAKTTATT